MHGLPGNAYSICIDPVCKVTSFETFVGCTCCSTFLLESCSQFLVADTYDIYVILCDFSGGEQPNSVLLFTIMNPQYPITVDVMHTVCTPHGNVNRIVIFKKNGVQAMVEYPFYANILCKVLKKTKSCWLLHLRTCSRAYINSSKV